MEYHLPGQQAALDTRNRMVYEQMSYAYGREDILRRDADGRLKLLQRVIDFEERFVRGKNLLFIL